MEVPIDYDLLADKIANLIAKASKEVNMPMKILGRVEIKKLTGTVNVADQVAVLRRHGLNPFVCSKTGRPLLTEYAVNQAMLKGYDTRDKWKPNMSVFDPK